MAHTGVPLRSRIATIPRGSDGTSRRRYQTPSSRPHLGPVIPVTPHSVTVCLGDAVFRAGLSRGHIRGTNSERLPGNRIPACGAHRCLSPRRTGHCLCALRSHPWRPPKMGVPDPPPRAGPGPAPAPGRAPGAPRPGPPPGGAPGAPRGAPGSPLPGPPFLALLGQIYTILLLIWGFWGVPGHPPKTPPGTPPGRPPRGGQKSAHFFGYLITLPVGTVWATFFDPPGTPHFGPPPGGYPSVLAGRASHYATEPSRCRHLAPASASEMTER